MAESARPSPCPRCGAPITGAFKFCPTCACRLRGPADSNDPPPATPSHRSIALVALLLGVLIAAVIWLGVVIFRPVPQETAPFVAEPPPPPRPTLTVREHFQDLFSRTLLGGNAANLDPDPGAETQSGSMVVVGDSEMLIFEVTRGMYAEFLADMEQHGKNEAGFPAYLRFMEDLWRPTRTEGDATYAERLDYTSQYIDVWWELVEAHIRDQLEAQADENGDEAEITFERPADLKAPLPPRYDVWLMVPPSWFYRTQYEELAWKMPVETDNLPVTEISWFEARAFVQWVNDTLDMECRLPTQWEWLRGGNGAYPNRLYPWGSDPWREACNNLNRWGEEDKLRPLRVDYRFSDDTGITKEGLYAMSGNAREWTLNSRLVQKAGFWVTEGVDETQYSKAPTCGGSFRMGIQDCRVTTDSIVEEEKLSRFDDLGFRVWRHVRSL